MNGDERDGLFLGVRSALNLANRLFPICAHVGSEGPQTANVVCARHFEKEVRVGERTVGASPVALTKLGTNVQEGNSIGEESMGRGRAGLLRQGLESRDHGLSEAVAISSGFVQRLSWGNRSGRSGSGGRASEMLSNSSSVNPISGPRSNAPSAKVSRPSASVRNSAIRS